MASFSAAGSYESSRLGEGFIHAILRRGHAAGAEGMARFTREAIRKGRALATHLDARIDAGLVEGPVLDVIDDEAVRFVGRIKNNARLDALAQPYLSRAPGRPTKEGDEFAVELGDYQAASWTRPYRVVLLERVQRWWRDEAWGHRGPRRRRWVAPPAHAHLCLVLRE